MKPYEKAAKMRASLERLANEYGKRGRLDVMNATMAYIEDLGPPGLMSLYDIVTEPTEPVWEPWHDDSEGAR
jgi:hypothetical protein